MRMQLVGDPSGVFLHDVIVGVARRFPNKIALVDTSCDPARRLTFAEYVERVERLARGLVAGGIRPGEMVALWLANSWEFAAAYHATTLAGAIPTLLNPSYRDREVRYQLETSGAVFLLTDGTVAKEVDLSGLPNLRRVYFTRTAASGAEPLEGLLKPKSSVLHGPDAPAEVMLAALPFSSGTTGLPKGVMLSHTNLVSNIYQLLGPGTAFIQSTDTVLSFLPLYHIYGLNVVLNTVLAAGATLVLMPRFHPQQLTRLLVEEGCTALLVVPPALNAFCQLSEQGAFPREHRLDWVLSGAAPLPPELARRFTQLTGVIVNQGYGMTEASPVTHLGHVRPTELNRPWTIGQPLSHTDCRLLDENGNEVPVGERGELVVRGPQVMLGYWKDPGATTAVLRDGWYWSGDVAVRDADDFFTIVDRRKEMIKYKGFPVAPAEVEAVLMEHPAVRDCGVVARPNPEAGEIPCAFVVLREGQTGSEKLGEELCVFVAEHLTSYKQPREIRFVDSLPRTPSGKILRRELKQQLS